MIGPLDILDEAKELARTAHGREVRRRSAISRAYYAAFHRADEVAKAGGYRYDPARDTGSHVQLLRFLGGSPDANAKQAAQSLKILKDQRVLADYRLGRDIPMNIVRQVIEQAEYLLTELLPVPDAS